MKWEDKRPWLVQARQRNELRYNPICRRCGFRTYPAWGEHNCKIKPDPVKIRHWAGMITSYLDFYRVRPEMQIAALLLALAYILGRNTDGERGVAKFVKAVPWVKRTIHRQGGLDPRLTVRSLATPKNGKLTARKTRKR